MSLIGRMKPRAGWHGWKPRIPAFIRAANFLYIPDVASSVTTSVDGVTKLENLGTGGTVHDLVAISAGTTPGYLASDPVFDGRASVVFDGTDDLLQGETAANATAVIPLHDGTGISLYVAYRLAATGANQTLVANAGAGSAVAGSRLEWLTATQQVQYHVGNGSAGAQIQSTAHGAAAPTVARAQWKNGEAPAERRLGIHKAVDDSDDIAFAPDTSARGRLTLGLSPSGGGQPLNGAIACVAGYFDFHSNAHAEQVIRWMRRYFFMHRLTDEAGDEITNEHGIVLAAEP